jgi:hypothetical protein
MGFGAYGGFPRRFGAGRSTLEVEHQAMLESLAPGYDVDESSPIWAETYAHAMALSVIWALNRRLEGRMIPARMLETLTTWEAAMRLRPRRSDTPQARRRAVAAKFLGLAGNTISNIYDVCALLAGPLFLGLAQVEEAAAIWYAPGLAPGPPGFEWTSNRATIAVRLQKSGTPDADFLALLQRLAQTLAAMVPAWMTFRVGTDEEGFVADLGLVDLTLIGAS